MFFRFIQTAFDNLENSFTTIDLTKVEDDCRVLRKSGGDEIELLFGIKSIQRKKLEKMPFLRIAAFPTLSLKAFLC